MKHTKKAKKVEVQWKEFKWVEKRSEFQCPCCGTYYQNTISTNVIRFRCDCGQELIVQ